MKLGTNTVSNFRLGTNQVSRIYLGNDLVWPLDVPFSLTNSFKNALISDLNNNITRTNNILITSHNAGEKSITVNSTGVVDQMRNNQVTGKSWFICQGTEASVLVDITSIPTSPNNKLFYGTTYLGTPNFAVGQKVEFLNPFVNYSIIPAERPLFDPYPTTAGGLTFNYIQPGGVFKKANGQYVLMCPVVRGSHVSRDVFYATSSDLENWTFQDTKILDTSGISFAKKPGNVFTVNNPYKLSNGNWLFLLAVERSNGNYTGAYMVINDDLDIVTAPTILNIDGWNSTTKNYFPLALTYHNGRFRIFLHDRANGSDQDKSSIEYTRTVSESDSNLISFLTGSTAHTTKTVVFNAATDQGYLHGKVDDIVYVFDGNDLNILIGGEEEPSPGWVTSNNREYGLAKLSGATSWIQDVRSPLIITPMQLFRKYPALSFFWDHMGTSISPYIFNNTMYLYIAAGGDSPDYRIAGIKINLNQ